MRLRWGGILLALALSACASRMSTDSLPSGAALPAGTKIPSNTTVAIYVPSNYRKSRVFLGRAWATPGKALEDGISGVAQHFFTQSFLVEPGSTQPYGLLLAIQPEWKFENGNIRMTMNYRVYGSGGPVLLEGRQSFAAPIGDLSSSDGFFNAALRSAQLVVIDVLAKLQPDSSRYPAVAEFSAVDAKLYVNHDKPVVSGTGFFINRAGQVMTAAHVLHDCALIEVRRDDKVLNTKLRVASPLLDLAVMDTQGEVAAPLPLRQGEQIVLGEPVGNVGFPLQPILSANPSLTRGNISSKGALLGALGQFQFSAPIQPGSSGGPVVSDGGELLGITLSTLNAAPLIEKGILPQNVNFALDARYAAQFLRRNNLAFTEVTPNPKGDMQTGNQAALSAVVSVGCYQ
ncbi:S1 family peptidase [Hydrocarboniphaga sp.]|uniref:S1 family peptidase n=1 Tax=Hydrocarboniphaga sp. TaxID=2033016 RepID=UPI003D0BCA04